MENPKIWTMFAHRYPTGHLMHTQPNGEILRSSVFSDPVIEVEVREVDADDPEATHWGWFDNRGHGPRGHDVTVPTMLQPSEPQFMVQFQYSPEASVRRGHGRIARFVIKEIDTA